MMVREGRVMGREGMKGDGEKEKSDDVRGGEG